MADLNRQLQEYLSQSKGGSTKTISQSGSSTASSGRSGGLSWPWSAEPDPCLPGMSRRQRLLAFGVCVSFSALCFGLSALYAPLLLLYARKFALLWSLGSVFAIAAAAVLRGPSRLAAGLPTSPEPPCTCALSGDLVRGAEPPQHRTDRPGRRLQVAVIAGCLVSLLPGGSAGIRFMGAWRSGVFTAVPS
uniref:Vesicle transport protein n=1 Tax=Oreochromis niloticus TaxID=8128 RepID=A0A669C2L7_ORENI